MLFCFFSKDQHSQRSQKAWLLKSGECLKCTEGRCKRGRFITLCSNSILRLKWEEYVNYHDHNKSLFIQFSLCCSDCVTSLRTHFNVRGMSEWEIFVMNETECVTLSGDSGQNRQLLCQGLTGIKHKYQSLLDFLVDRKPLDLTVAEESGGKQASHFIKLTNIEWYYIIPNKMNIGKRKVSD